MQCNKEVNITDKIIAFIKLKIPDYVYTHGDFYVYEEEGLLIKNWNFKFDKPTYVDLGKIEVVKECQKDCLCCLIEKIEKLEEKVKDMRAEIDTFQ